MRSTFDQRADGALPDLKCFVLRSIMALDDSVPNKTQASSFLSRTASIKLLDVLDVIVGADTDADLDAERLHI